MNNIAPLIKMASTPTHPVQEHLALAATDATPDKTTDAALVGGIGGIAPQFLESAPSIAAQPLELTAVPVVTERGGTASCQDLSATSHPPPVLPLNATLPSAGNTPSSTNQPLNGSYNLNDGTGGAGASESAAYVIPDVIGDATQFNYLAYMQTMQSNAVPFQLAHSNALHSDGLFFFTDDGSASFGSFNTNFSSNFLDNDPSSKLIAFQYGFGTY